VANLDIYIDDKLLEGINRLAIEHYGDDSEASRKRVVETALKMRMIWSRSVEGDQGETDEAVSEWEFPELQPEDDTDSIKNWLFRR